MSVDSYMKELKSTIAEKIPNSPFFAGVGSRNIRHDGVKERVENIMPYLKNMILRSGGATGMDTLFEQTHRKQGGTCHIFLAKHVNQIKNEQDRELLKSIASYYHPFGKGIWKNPYVGNLLTRNFFQVIGVPRDEKGNQCGFAPDLIVPVRFALLYTPDNCTSHKERTRETGGTGQFISYADALGIPIFNLRDKDSDKIFLDWLGKQQ